MRGGWVGRVDDVIQGSNVGDIDGLGAIGGRSRSVARGNWQLFDGVDGGYGPRDMGWEIDRWDRVRATLAPPRRG